MCIRKNLELFKHALKRGNTFGRTVEQTKEIIKGQEKALSIIKNGKADVILVNDSRLYKVDIPENDVLLDEQKSLLEQPSKVREAFHTYLGGNYNSYQSASGRELYEMLSREVGYSSKSASLWLNEHGVKGITYEGGRDGRCFVIFDDKAVKILETYEQQIKDQIAGNGNDNRRKSQ